MKKSFLISMGFAMGLLNASQAQTINWLSLQDNQKHIANVNAGWDYSTSLGFGYAYLVKVKVPVLLNAQFSLPAGRNTTDDFKAKVGFQARIYRSGRFVTTVTMRGIFRQYQADMAKLQNYGGEFAAVAGYYRAKWFIAGEAGFDKAITTRIINSEVMKQYYPSIKDGWYVPTGGNFNFGIQTGYSLKRFDFYLRTGLILDQSFRLSAVIPYYAQLGLNMRF